MVGDCGGTEGNGSGDESHGTRRAVDRSGIMLDVEASVRERCEKLKLGGGSRGFKRVRYDVDRRVKSRRREEVGKHNLGDMGCESDG